MSNHLFGYARGGYGGGEAGTSNLYSSRSVANTGESSFLGTSSRYLSLDSITPSSISSSLLYVPENYSVRIPGIGTPANSYDPPGVDLDSTVASIDSRHSGWKRNTSELPYEPTILGAQIKIGQTEAWYSTDLIDKRPRYESTSHLPIYPQRPGEKDCEFYMQTRTCKFGDSCKFHHPIWVPEGGAPNWKEVPVAPVESLPERPGEPDCPYFLKTKRCKFGSRCKFNHPKDLVVSQGELEDYHSTFLPERPSEPQCAFYMKTGKCKFGATCKFDHPKGVHPQSDGDESGTPVQYQVAGNTKLVDPSVAPALMHNSKGLPIRLGEEDCPFYLKTGSCKYGATCRFNHPDRYAAVTPSHLTSPSTHLSIGFPTASLLSNFDPRLTQTTANLLGLMPTAYPQRPGQSECDYYMKTGSCKYGSSCKFHHPLDRSARSASTTGYQMENVKLTLAGLPRREGAIHCPFYMKTGLCKYGATCKFDHPPPGEVVALATSKNFASEGHDDGDP